MRQRRSFNPKREIMPVAGIKSAEGFLQALAAKVRYGGNPEHKRNPGDFNLTPPAAPRRGKTLCDDARIFRRADALSLLQSGIRMGLVDARWNLDGWPQIVWAVSPDGCPLEAQREADGVYHGYPMQEADPLRDVVIGRWRAACATA